MPHRAGVSVALAPHPWRSRTCRKSRRAGPRAPAALYTSAAVPCLRPYPPGRRHSRAVEQQTARDTSPGHVSSAVKTLSVASGFAHHVPHIPGHLDPPAWQGDDVEPKVAVEVQAGNGACDMEHSAGPESCLRRERARRIETLVVNVVARKGRKIGGSGSLLALQPRLLPPVPLRGPVFLNRRFQPRASLASWYTGSPLGATLAGWAADPGRTSLPVSAGCRARSDVANSSRRF